MSILARITATQAGWAALPLRIALGVTFFREGTKKLYGWFGGGGWASTCTFFSDLGIPLPELNAFFIGYTEFLGGVAILIGLFSRAAALGIGATMVVAILTAHTSGGWEYPLIVLAGCMTLLFIGSGNLSGDQKLFHG